MILIRLQVRWLPSHLHRKMNKYYVFRIYYEYRNSPFSMYMHVCLFHLFIFYVEIPKQSNEQFEVKNQILYFFERLCPVEVVHLVVLVRLLVLLGAKFIPNC